MIFNTWSFALFGFITITTYWAFVPAKFRPYYLAGVGAIFYVFSVPLYLLLIIALGTITYVIASRMLHEPDRASRRLSMAIGVTLIAATLIVFKYSGFLARTVDAIANQDILPVPNIVVPLAISFFTFEFVHVLVDVYLGKILAVEPLEFSVFSMFFPTLVAGPIKRYQSFVPQLRDIRMPADRELGLHLYRIMIGLAKKFIIADSMTPLTQALIAPTGTPFGRLDYVAAMLAYTAKIYFDFSAYSDIAIGLAGLLGLAIPENFDRPYWSTNISVFWRRWHISLSSWIRDYVFIPLGGSRRPPAFVALNLFLAMAIAGLWHGAAWTFVAWGLWHGIGLVAHRIWTTSVVPAIEVLRKPSVPLSLISTIVTFLFVVVGWTLFAAPSFDAAEQVLSRVLSGAVPNAGS